MRQLQFRYDENIDVRRLGAVFKMQRDCFLDISEEFIRGLALRKDVFSDAASAPAFAILVDFHLHEHSNCLVEYPTPIAPLLGSGYA